jgi:hypothetical protein
MESISAVADECRLNRLARRTAPLLPRSQLRWRQDGAAARRDGASFRHPSTDARQSGNLQATNLPEDAVTMSKPAKTESELIAMARAELKVHVDCPDGIVISVIPDGDSWEFRAEADDATIARPGFPECVAMLVQIGDHLCKQYNFKG